MVDLGFVCRTSLLWEHIHLEESGYGQGNFLDSSCLIAPCDYRGLDDPHSLK